MYNVHCTYFTYIGGTQRISHKTRTARPFPTTKCIRVLCTLHLRTVTTRNNTRLCVVGDDCGEVVAVVVYFNLRVEINSVEN